MKIIPLVLLVFLSFPLFAQAPNEGDCGGALSLCNLVFTEPSPGTDEGTFLNEFPTDATCLTDGEDNSVWYTFTAASDGFLSFVITPDDPNDDYDWVLFDLTNADCSDLANNAAGLVVSCNAAGGTQDDPNACHGQTGANLPVGTGYSNQGGGCGFDPPSQTQGLTPFNEVIPVIAGNNYTLMISNWTGSTSGYTIDFSASTGLGTQDMIPPTVEAIIPPPDCSTSEVQVTFSENIQCSTITASNFQITGPGGPYSVVLSSPSCDAGGDHDRTFSLIVTPPIPGSGTYTFSLITNGTTQVLDLCGNPAASWNTTFSTNYSFDNPPLINPNPQSVCEDDMVTISPSGNNAIASSSFNFYGDAGLNNLLHSGDSYSFTATNSTSIWVTEFTPYCESPANEYVLNVFPNPPLPDADIPADICQGDPIGTLMAFGTGNPGNVFNWYDQDPSFGNPSVIGTGSSFTPTTSTNSPGDIEFYVEEVSQAGCVSPPLLVVVHVVATPATPTIEQTQNICVDDPAPSLSASGSGGTITWYDGDPGLGTPNQLGTGNPFTPIIDTGTTGSTDIYVTEINSTGCESTANYVTINVNPTPVVMTNDINCSGDVQSYSVSISTSFTASISVNTGSVQDVGGGNYTIDNIPIANSLIITANSGAAGCETVLTIEPPTCGCPNIDPPTSGGNQEICVGEAIPALTVNVPSGMTADWYDASTGGTLLQAGTTSYTPSAEGTYYAETRQSNGTCTSATRIPVSLTIHPLPIALDTVTVCSEDLMTYDVSLTFQNADTITAHSEGTVVNNGNGSFDITGISSGNNLTLTATLTATNCQLDMTIPAPDCSCPSVSPPVSQGDQIVCQGETIPALTVTVGDGETVNWYDTATNGNLLLSNNASFTPTMEGTYYAETSVTVSNCTSDTRTPVTLTIQPLPELQDTIKNCAPDLTSYNVTVLLNSGDSISTTSGTITVNSTTNYLISEIPVGENITVTIFDNTSDCQSSFLITAPNCVCDEVTPPLNTGNFMVCAESPLPQISASVGSGVTIDWYDLPIGGNLVAQGMIAFTPDSLGTYYAESRLTENGCTSDTRTPVSLTENPLPAITSITPTCSADLLSYDLDLIFENTDTIMISSGNLSIAGSTFTIANIAISDTLFITALNQSTLCQDDFAIPPPDCECLAVQPPVSGGDHNICEGEAIPSLTASVNAGETVDWYDALLDGNLLQQSSTTFTPLEAGTYYAETRDEVSDCVSSNRTPITLTINPLPQLSDTIWTCAEDLMSYSSEILTTADSIISNAGEIINIGDGIFDILNIPVDTGLEITLINTATDCRKDYTFPLPSCECPDIAPPVSLGNQEICAGETLPTLEVSVGSGMTVDWYDAMVGGNLLLSDSPVFTPTAAGNYFAEARATVSNCVSDTRTMVQLIENELPLINIVSMTNPGCGLDNGMIEIAANQGAAPYSYQIDNGAVQNDGNFTGLSGDTPLAFMVTDNNGCKATLDTSLVGPIGPEAIISEGDTLTCSHTAFSVDAAMTNADGGVTFEWLHDGVFVSDFIQIEITEPGQYILLVQQDGCSDSDTLNVVEITDVNLEVVITANQQLNCAINSVVLDGSQSSSGANIAYQWLLDNTPIPSATQNTYTATEPGLYELEVTELATGCSHREVYQLDRDATAPTANAGDDQKLDCDTNQVTLDGSGSSGNSTLSYQWYSGDEQIEGATQPSYSTQSAGLYLLEVTDEGNQCKDDDEVLVVMDTLRPIADAGSDMTLYCNEEQLSLDGSASFSPNGLTYEWQTTNGSILSGANTPTPLIGSAGVYSLLVIDQGNGCNQSDVVSVDRIDKIETNVIVSSKDVGCSGENDGLITLSPENPNSTLLYSVNQGAFSSTGIFSGLEPGTYQLTAEDVNGCQWDTTLTILNGRDLDVSLKDIEMIRYGDSLQLPASLNITEDTTLNISWTNAELLNCNDCLTPWTAPLYESTEFDITVTDENGCSDSEKIRIIVDATKHVFIPNSFSPNGDGINDMLYIQSGNDVVKVHNFQIFNRWGEVVFTAQNFDTNDALAGWDGRVRGKVVNAAVYIYLAEVEFIDGRKEVFSGEVVLVR